MVWFVSPEVTTVSKIRDASAAINYIFFLCEKVRSLQDESRWTLTIMEAQLILQLARGYCHFAYEYLRLVLDHQILVALLQSVIISTKWEEHLHVVRRLRHLFEDHVGKTSICNFCASSSNTRLSTVGRVGE